MKKIIIINKMVFFKYINIVFFFNLESKSIVKDVWYGFVCKDLRTYGVYTYFQPKV